MKYSTTVFLFMLIFGAQQGLAQYNFTVTTDCQCTEVKSQDRTGTCWSYSTISYLESELIRLGEGNFDLSEMQIVRTIYMDKARNYLLRQGKANFSQGSLGHDVIRAMRIGGLSPESAYSGLLPGQDRHDHSELVKELKSYLEEAMANEMGLSSDWEKACNAILDKHMGPIRSGFHHKGVKQTPKSFAASLPIKADDYINFTSFTHHPFDSEFILEIPDNYSNGSYINLTVDELISIVDNALSKGMSVAWDGDVSEATFSANNGLAILPEDAAREDLWTKPGAEIAVTQENRQAAFMSYETTDDHLMHITGSAVDQTGTKYYIVKNSWGEISEYKGFLYMSEAYFRMKTVGFVVHKDAVPTDLRKRLGI